MATAQTKFYEAASTPVQVGRGTVATHALTFAVDDTGTVDVLAMGAIINTGNSSETWSITPPSGVTVSPSSGTLIASGTQALDVTATAPGTYSLTLVCAGATITGNPQSFVASAAPTYATAMVLGGASNGTTGVAGTMTVTPNGPLEFDTEVTLSSSETLSTTTLTFLAGATAAQSFTITADNDATHSVTMTNDQGLTNSGSPRSYTSATPGDGAADWLARSTADGVVVAYDFSAAPAAGGDWKWGSLSASPKVTVFAQNQDYYPNARTVDTTVYPQGSTASLRWDVDDFGSGMTLEFTADVQGATSGTMTLPFTPVLGNPVSVVFEGGATRDVTISGTSVTWSGALPTGAPITTMNLPDYGTGERGDLWWISLDDYADQFDGDTANNEFWVQWRTRMNDVYATFNFEDRQAVPGPTTYKQLMVGEGMQTTMIGVNPAWPHGYEGPGTSISQNHISYARVDFEGETNIVGNYGTDGTYTTGYGFKYPAAYHGKPGYLGLLTKGEDNSYYTYANHGDEGNHVAACQFQIGTGYTDKSTCFRYPVDEWFTMTMHVILGPRGHALSSLGNSTQNVGATRIDATHILLEAGDYTEHFRGDTAAPTHVEISGATTGTVDAEITDKDTTTYPGQALLTLANLSGPIQAEALTVDEHENGFTDSTIEYYAALQNEPMTLLHRRTGVVMRVGNYPEDLAYTATARYGSFAWTTFMTSKSLTQTHDRASVWVGQIIVKAGTEAPAAPMDVPDFVHGLGDFEVRSMTGAYAPSNGDETLHDVIPLEWQGGSGSGINGEAAIFTAWCGGKGDAASKRLFVHGGGHTDSANNGLYYYDFTGAGVPTGWVLQTNSLSALADVEYNIVYDDDKPNSVHTYDQQWYDPTLDRWYRFGGSTWSLDGGATGIYYYDFGTEAWSCDPSRAAFSADNVSAKLGGTVMGKSDGTKLLWIDGDYPNNGYFYDSDGTAHLCTVGFNRNSTGAGCVGVNVGGDTWLTLSIMSGSTWLYTHAVNWAANTITSTQRTHASHSTYLTGNNSAAGSLVYDPDHSDGPCVWVFGLARHCTGSTMSTEILRIDLSDWSITAHTMTGDAIAIGASGSAGSYNRHVWFPEWRVIGTVQGYAQPMSIIKLPT